MAFSTCSWRGTMDLLVVSSADLTDRLMPAGRLREPLSAARAADAVLVYGDAENARRVAARVGVSRSFCVTRRVRPLRPLSPAGAATVGERTRRCRGRHRRPERFFDALRQTHAIARELVFADHHWFTDADVARDRTARTRAGVTAVVTTAKDGVRLDRCRGAMSLPWAILPIEVSIEPGAEFESWLRQRL